jgi:outer membrane lipoprotein-sorting protein
MTNYPTGPVACFALLVAVLVLSAAGGDECPEADGATAWMAHLRSCLGRVFSIRAEFVQERWQKLHGVRDEWRGTLEVKRGGRYRITYVAPNPRLLVSDGTRSWAYIRSAKVAYSSPEGDATWTRIAGFLVGDEVKKAFNSSLLTGASQPAEGLGAVELTPREKDPFLASLVLVLDNRCPCIRRLLVTHHDGSVTRVTLSEVRFNVGIGKRRFTFTPPRGTRVVGP